jgi:hypothetical protein
VSTAEWTPSVAPRDSADPEVVAMAQYTEQVLHRLHGALQHGYLCEVREGEAPYDLALVVVVEEMPRDPSADAWDALIVGKRIDLALAWLSANAPGPHSAAFVDDARAKLQPAERPFGTVPVVLLMPGLRAVVHAAYGVLLAKPEDSGSMFMQAPGGAPS